MTPLPPSSPIVPTPPSNGACARNATTWHTLRATLRSVTFGRPHLAVVGAGLAAFALSWLAAFQLRFEFEVTPHYHDFMLQTVAFVVLIKLVAFAAAGTFDILWAYFSLRDALKIGRATLIATGAIAVADTFLVTWIQIPRSVLLLDGLLTFLAIAGLFGALRWARESLLQRAGSSLPAEPIFVVGAGDAGEGLLRELQRPGAPVRVVGFLDDDPAKHRQLIHGAPVLGAVSDARPCAHHYGVRKAFIAIPSADGPTLRKIVRPLLDAGLSVRVLPPAAALSSSGNFVPQLREVAIEDLLRREPVKLDTEGISAFIRGKRILVTGAAGSIGSELCRQILAFGPSRLIALDNAESPLHSLILEFAGAGSDAFRPELADVTDSGHIDAIFAEHRPQAVFHAAAYKHVPMMEAHPREAVRVNLTGTRIVSEAARASGTEAFVLISTDKAVNPENVMGTTKRIAERLVLGECTGAGGRRLAVRFGNVLGSNGSVLPLFRAQIAKGGPLTITHPEMRRYFMTIPEAVQLVLQAAVIGIGGETFMLDMGEPVKISDLAEDLIRLSGLVPGVDVKIEFTGMRPGEKLFEELAFDTEKVGKTIHPKIWYVKSETQSNLDVVVLDQLERSVHDASPERNIRSLLQDLVPQFRSSHRKVQVSAGSTAAAL